MTSVTTDKKIALLERLLARVRDRGARRAGEAPPPALEAKRPTTAPLAPGAPRDFSREWEDAPTVHSRPAPAPGVAERAAVEAAVGAVSAARQGAPAAGDAIAGDLDLHATSQMPAAPDDLMRVAAGEETAPASSRRLRTAGAEDDVSVVGAAPDSGPVEISTDEELALRQAQLDAEHGDTSGVIARVSSRPPRAPSWPPVAGAEGASDPLAASGEHLAPWSSQPAARQDAPRSAPPPSQPATVPPGSVSQPPAASWPTSSGATGWSRPPQEPISETPPSGARRSVRPAVEGHVTPPVEAMGDHEASFASPMPIPQAPRVPSEQPREVARVSEPPAPFGRSERPAARGASQPPPAASERPVARDISEWPATSELPLSERPAAREVYEGRTQATSENPAPLLAHELDLEAEGLGAGATSQTSGAALHVEPPPAPAPVPAMRPTPVPIAAELVAADVTRRVTLTGGVAVFVAASRRRAPESFGALLDDALRLGREDE